MELSDPNHQQQLQYTSSTSSSSQYHHEVVGGEGSSTMMSSSSQEENDFREHMFDKVVTPSDVGKLNRLVIPKQHAEKYFPLDSSSNEKGLLLNFEDKGGKAWRFRYSYWNSSQSYVMTKGWSRFVKEKKLNAGDIVSFQRGRSAAGIKEESDQLFKYYIDWRRRMPPPLPDQYQYYYHHQPSSLLQFQHGSSPAAGAWSLHQQHVLRPQYHLPLPPPPPPLPNLHCFTRDHHHPHLSQMQMMIAPTTTSTSDHNNNLYFHHSFPVTPTPPTHNTHTSSSGYNGVNINHQQQHYYQQIQNDHRQHFAPSTTITNPYPNPTTTSSSSSLVHHGSVVYVGPIRGERGGVMQTRHHNNPAAGPHLQATASTASIADPMLFHSLPVMNKAAPPKRLRLFGVNMDCQSPTGDDDEQEDNEEDDDDHHIPENYNDHDLHMDDHPSL